MGAVFAAVDNLRRVPVALKRLLADRFKTPAELERATALFEREYHTLSQLAHPHVISVFDYGVDASGPYYTMERLRGDSLRARAPLPWREAARVIRDVASALAIVHSRRLVHRDVTPQNIYYDAESGAKLFDFGAMIPMGVAKQLVGTPAFIAPECVQAQPLDGQTDLFSLGACLYFALSGRNAYPARDLASLEHVWRQTPLPLSHFAPDMPEALESLVESLLSLQPSGRPRTAADVYEQLTSIADLPRSESAQVVRAYLTRPALVGRDAELGKLRKWSDRAYRGRGTSVVLTSTTGMGRTRLLDASVLEAQLSGLRVARADDSDSGDRALGVIARLLSRLQEAGVDVGPALQSRELETLLTTDGAELLSQTRRERTLRDLPAALREIAERWRLALAVDDLESVDDPSLAVLAALAVEIQERPMLLLTTLDSNAPPRLTPSLRLLEESSRRMALAPLGDAESRMLLSSVFGEVPNLGILGSLCARRCLGNPRRLMESAQAVIDAQLAHYEGGTWVISPNAAELATALDRSTNIENQLATLSADAVELLEAIALDRDSIMSLADYTALTDHNDSGRMHRALTELIAADWIAVDGDRARLRRDDQLRLVAAGVPADRATKLHTRLAERSTRPDLPPVYPTYHYIKAGNLEAALAPMAAMSDFVDANPSHEIVRSAISLETLQVFSELADVPTAHPGSRANYAAALVTNAMYQGLPELGAPKVHDALREIAKFTGISDYREASHLPDNERLHYALTRANERCAQPGIGGLDLLRALRRQTQVCLSSAVCASFMADSSLLEGLPDLMPFVALSPALAIAACVLDGLSKQARGQTWLAWDEFQKAHGQLFGPSAEAIDGLTLVGLRVATLGYLGAIEAEHACPELPAHLEQYTPLMAHSAMSLRARYSFANGDLAACTAARKQCELLSVQGNALMETRNTETTSYLALYTLADDLLGLRRAYTEIVPVAKNRPGWQFRVAIARCQILRCQNRIAEALMLAESVLVNVPVEHIDFAGAASTHLELLLAARRFEDARRQGDSYLERSRAASIPTFRVEFSLAVALAELGEHDAAEKICAHVIRDLDQRRVGGLILGRAYETSARVALRRGDSRNFSERADRCAIHYAVHQNPTLATRFGKLMREAARAGLISSEPVSGISEQASAVAALRELASTDDNAFYTGALDFLVKRAGAAGGFLYVCTKTGLRRVAATRDTEWSDMSEVDRAAAAHYERQLGGDMDSMTVDFTSQQPQLTGTEHYGTRGRTLWPCVLTRPRIGDHTIEGVVMLVGESGTQHGVPRNNLDQVAALMTLRSETITGEPSEPEPESVSTTGVGA